MEVYIKTAKVKKEIETETNLFFILEIEFSCAL